MSGSRSRWFAVLLSGLLLGAGAAPGWAGYQVATGVTNGLGTGRNPFDKTSQRKVARDAFDRWLVVYSRVNAGTGRNEVHLARSRDFNPLNNQPDASEWPSVCLFGQGGLVVDSSTSNYVFPTLDVSESRYRLGVAVLDLTANDVLYTQNGDVSKWDLASGWTQAGGGTSPRYDTVNASVYATTAPGLAFDAANRPHLAYVRANASSRPSVYYRTWQGSWGSEVEISDVSAAGTAFPTELDPSIDYGSNGWVHVVYKDDSNVGDSNAKTDRYRYVRNAVSGNYAGFASPVTVISAGVNNDLGQPPSLAAQGNDIWLVGGFAGTGTEWAWFNYSSTNGASWAQGAAGLNFECSSSFDVINPVVGTNPAGSDHRVAAMRDTTNNRLYRYLWTGSNWVDGTCGSHTQYLLGFNGSASTDRGNVAIEKHKPATAANQIYCFYNSFDDAPNTPPPPADSISCDTMGPLAATPRPTYRAIGTRADDTGNATVTRDSPTVTGVGTQWRTNNRGVGDRLTINVSGTDYHYVVASVQSDTQLTLASPVLQASGTYAYALARQFETLQGWEDCVSRSAANTCKRPADPQEYFATASSSLVADNRIEVGVAYEDSVFAHSTSGNGAGLPVLRIDGATTSATNTITLTAVGPNRHYGLPGTGVVLDAETSTGGGVWVFDDHVSLEWLEIKGGSGATAHGITIGAPASGSALNLRSNLIHDVPGNGIDVYQASNANLLVANNIVHHTGGHGVYLDPTPLAWNGQILVLNNTVSATGGGATSCYKGVGGVGSNQSHVLLVNNIGYTLDGGTALKFDFPDNDPANGWADVNPQSRRNISSDTSANTVNVTDPGVPINGGTVNFVNNNVGVGDYHLNAANVCAGCSIDLGADVSALMAPLDIDAQSRPKGAAWDIGADEFGSPTAVTLTSFEARPGDRSVLLEWRTGSELSNLGFHVYRGSSADGPWERLTQELIPGLGSSAVGQAYSWRDGGLTNGMRYYYRLEDVDTASVSTYHGPVSAIPVSAASPPGEGGGDDGGGEGVEGGGGEPADGSCPSWVLAAAPDAVSPTCTRHGDPDAVSFQVLARGSSSATVELRTGGFWVLRGAAGEVAGEVRVFVPGLELPADAKAPALPVRRALVDAVTGKQVRLVSAEALEVQSFPGLRPSAVGQAEMHVARDGTLRPARRPLPAPFLSRGLVPHEVARLAGTAFQGERKSAVVEITPVRFDGSGQTLVLARRVRVKLSFAGVAEGEVRTAGGGRVLPPRGFSRDVLAQLHTTRRGLHAVRYEALFPADRRGFSAALLRLQRQGEAVPFRVAPAGPLFGPGSVLYFFADRTAASTDYSSEVAYELVRGSGVRMGVASAAPTGGTVVSPSTGFSAFETNRIYQPGLLEAPDLWLWDGMASGVTRTQAFTLSGVITSTGEPARLAVRLQGGSESGYAVDHHVRVSLNGVSVGEATFAGKRPYRLEAPIPASLLQEGANELSVTNVGDTGVSSLVFLDRIEVSHPQASAARGGVFEGVWTQGGTVEVSGLSGPPVILRDSVLPGPEGSAVQWVTGYQTTGSSACFRAEAGVRYVVVSPEGLLAPRVARVPVSTLKAGTNQADYLVITPRELLEAATPLLERRRSQGLVSRAVSFEEVASEFGRGQPSAEAIRAFLSHAYHSWQRPSPRYVVLLGDATYDPRRFLSTSWASPLPPLWTRTSYLWTASDPALAAVNGDDLLPDLSIGRLPASTADQAEALVSKLLAWEDSGQGLGGHAVLVADTPDVAGDFEADVEDIRASFLSGRTTTTLKVRELGSAARPAILGAFDDGASLMSYVGHGGTAVWSSANVLNSWDTPSLRAQSRQPLLLTLNCLNGYFVAPNFDSLGEALVKVEGRGALAAFSPSGLSLDGPAHQYHRALMAELASGAHERLGDAVLAAQVAYARTGLMPELLGIYNLFGDPATKIR